MPLVMATVMAGAMVLVIWMQMVTLKLLSKVADVVVAKVIPVVLLMEVVEVMVITTGITV
jgi:hypothetical protein